MERERVQGCARLRVLQPGVIRGVDQLYEGPRTALIASDGSTPFRTTARLIERYDSDHVAHVLEEDLQRHGAPLVYRMDRASCHRTAQVRAVLEAHGVLLLHGPARYPQFYGQHERQNREHRAWLAGRELTDELLQEMMACLNGSWRRRSLNWNTASDRWAARGVPGVDRCTLRLEVEDRTARLSEQLRNHRDRLELARRRAIEQALMHRGLISREAGGWC